MAVIAHHRKLRSDAIQGRELRQLLTLALDGVGYKTIAHQLNRHAHTISLIARKHGIRRYKRNPCPPLLSTDQPKRSLSSSTPRTSTGSSVDSNTVTAQRSET